MIHVIDPVLASQALHDLNQEHTRKRYQASEKTRTDAEKASGELFEQFLRQHGSSDNSTH